MSSLAISWLKILMTHSSTWPLYFSVCWSILFDWNGSWPNNCHTALPYGLQSNPWHEVRILDQIQPWPCKPYHNCWWNRSSWTTSTSLSCVLLNQIQSSCSISCKVLYHSTNRLVLVWWLLCISELFLLAWIQQSLAWVRQSIAWIRQSSWVSIVIKNK